MIERAIDVYKTLRKGGIANATYKSISLDDLQEWVNRIFEHALLFKDHFLAIGLAIETNRDDILTSAVEIASKSQKTNILLKTLDLLTEFPVVDEGHERMLVAFTNLVLQLSDNEKHFMLKVCFQILLMFLYN